ncbi:DNA-binding response regulator [Photobacterium profundum]|uniref:Two-component response regulator of nitrate reduction n=1 Tax=Photobacterium profundum 3TCK TaxID=314280 RepID=Q1Z774_9GAMM|nr:response regulator transcription factor [Photobacterium profundum]EAS44229.1 two-component response regulator of nitrate reduction [Photobacterium profundum 3TCK]PSV63007.1 DNA-binding response regulator [Photobacterium profundum]
MSNLVLADDHLIVAQGVASLLEPEHTVLAIAKDGEELIALVKKHKPDLVITDISMPGMTGIAAVARLRRDFKSVKMICLTMHDEPEYAEGAIAAGANGYVLKHQAGEELVKAVDTVMNGGRYISNSIDMTSEKPTLTARQLSVLQLLVKGRSAKQVAEELFISSRTVEFHKYAMMRLLNVKTSAELIQYAINHGLIS